MLRGEGAGRELRGADGQRFDGGGTGRTVEDDLVPAVGPFPDWDDPEDVRWGLLPNALFRNLASLILGYDPVAERHQRKLAKESQENYERLSKLEKQAYNEILDQHRPPESSDGR